MKKRMKDILTEVQLWNCVLSKAVVILWFGDEQDDYNQTEIIEFNSEIIIGANKFYYLRENCQLFTNKNYLRLIQ